MAKKDVSLYRAIHHLRKGGLHRALGVSEDETIPEEKMDAAQKSPNQHVVEMSKFHAKNGVKNQ
jgi:hypothetical protein